MKKSTGILAVFAAMVLFAHAQAAEIAPEGANAPNAAEERQIVWYEIDPGVRKYLILLAANAMELSAELPDEGISPTAEQQIDMMEQVIRRTPLDSLIGEYLQFVTEANELNFRIIAALREEKPANHTGIMAVTQRFENEIDALCVKYPQAGRYFNRRAQMQITLMISRETDVQRVMMQSVMAGKTRRESMRTVVEHLRYEAERQF